MTLDERISRLEKQAEIQRQRLDNHDSVISDLFAGLKRLFDGLAVHQRMFEAIRREGPPPPDSGPN